MPAFDPLLIPYMSMSVDQPGDNGLAGNVLDRSVLGNGNLFLSPYGNYTFIMEE